MIKIETYMRRKSGELIPISDFNDNVNDPDYVEGSIEISVNDIVIVSRIYWDYVDQLWQYIVNALISLNEGEQNIEIRYPDQPISIKISVFPSNFAKISFDGKSVKVEKKISIFELKSALVKEAKNVFVKLQDINRRKSHVYDYELKRLDIVV